ncbi:hypothetical protein [Streptomyces sp. CMB-StM0423]|uniref:hypothetical protein n=1 Tax=Streptomyces sp. CMB-StM0423 TaxID=2059884 RepID=UPI000C713976|nr:hypothetical protein [Streptomyces sp. CMB-StM0423]AUH42375.1 hypothetical protein CXR04_21225 [Streptomyces sp. CMB-StM0423]
MRTYKLVLAAAAALASAGALVPATNAAADSADSAVRATAGTEVRDVSAQDLDCEDTAERYANSGTVNMYDRRQCKGPALCKDYDNDSHYGRGGQCKGGDNNDTSSAVNLGWNTRNDGVYFYSGYYKSSGERTLIGCLKRGHSWGQLDWADADNAVSSHQWGQC